MELVAIFLMFLEVLVIRVHWVITAEQYRKATMGLMHEPSTKVHIVWEYG